MLPLLGAFHGGRLNEFCQLRLDDVKQVGGVWVLDISQDSEDKHLKTAASKRLVPLHPILLEGLFADTSKRSGGAGTPGSYAHYASRWFSGYSRRLGVHAKQRKVYHSFRNTVIDTLMKQEYPLPMIQELVGHEQNSITFKHYGKGYKMSTLLEMVKAIDYGVDFARISAFK
jgi:integrase